MVNINLINVIHIFFEVLRYSIFARIIFSFFPLGRDANPTLLKVRQLAFALTEPLLAPFRSLIKPVHMGGGGYLDLSPIFALVALSLIRGFIFSRL